MSWTRPTKQEDMVMETTADMEMGNQGQMGIHRNKNDCLYAEHPLTKIPSGARSVLPRLANPSNDIAVVRFAIANAIILS